VIQISALLIVQKLREELNLGKPGDPHMSFTGSPGTGKTEVATHMADILFKFGYTHKEHLITLTRDDRVVQDIGYTAPKTKAVVKRTMDGVLFVDDTY
jgi:replication-associated recombination protein RarA